MESDVRKSSPVVQLTVSLAKSQTILRYHDIDFIGAQCVKDAHGKEKVLYQAHCGGSGCYDLDNWGIIDAKTLNVELVPRKHNAQIAKEILGRNQLKIKDKLVVFKEAEKLGLAAY